MWCWIYESKRLAMEEIRPPFLFQMLIQLGQLLRIIRFSILESNVAIVISLGVSEENQFIYNIYTKQNFCFIRTRSLPQALSLLNWARRFKELLLCLRCSSETHTVSVDWKPSLVAPILSLSKWIIKIIVMFMLSNKKKMKASNKLHKSLWCTKYLGWGNQLSHTKGKEWVLNILVNLLIC
jgi:hypothetical protein